MFSMAHNKFQPSSLIIISMFCLFIILTRPKHSISFRKLSNILLGMKQVLHIIIIASFLFIILELLSLLFSNSLRATKVWNAPGVLVFIPNSFFRLFNIRPLLYYPISKSSKALLKSGTLLVIPKSS